MIYQKSFIHIFLKFGKYYYTPIINIAFFQFFLNELSKFGESNKSLDKERFFLFIFKKKFIASLIKEVCDKQKIV